MLEYFNRLSQDSVYSPSDFLKDAFFDSVYYRKTGERLEKKKDDSFDLWFDEITTLLECHAWPFPNLWLGVTAENQRWADERIPTLLQIPAAVRFMSLEPLLGEMQIAKYLSEYKFRQDYCNKQSCGGCVFPRGHNLVTDGPCLGSKNWTENKNKVDWVIVGAETGPGRRECKLEWVRSIVQQCQAAGVPCFVKQVEVNGKISHDPNEWPVDLRVRQWPEKKPSIHKEKNA